MDNRPLVTITILSYNRKKELENNLQKVYDQDYKNIEVVVVDNASTDGSPEMVLNNFPGVEVIQLEYNIGIAGWNYGFEKARGDYILVLDDDSYPSNNAISKGLQFVEDNHSLGILAYNVFNLRLNRSETNIYNTPPVNSFIGCGALIKKEILKCTGFFDENYFIYYNEIDLSIRVYNCGYSIKYAHDLVIYHNQSRTGRPNVDEDPYTSSFRYYHDFLGNMYFLWKYFYLRYFIVYGSKYLLSRFFVSLKMGYVNIFFKAAVTFVKKINSIPRTTVNLKIQKQYRLGNKELFDRSYFSI